MTKFEYSDFYKFITSIGIVLISLSFLIPWLFLREPFDLLQRSDDVVLLTSLAQSIIHQRQLTIQTIIKLIPIFSAVSFTSGLFILIIGSRNWYRKTQMHLDRFNELNVKSLEQQLISVSAEVVRVRQEQEIIEDLEAENIEENENKTSSDMSDKPHPVNINKLVDSAVKVEKDLAVLLDSCFEDTHIVWTDRKFGNVFFDIVMTSNSLIIGEHYVFEVKYIRSGFKYSWLRDNLFKIVYASQFFQEKTNTRTVPVLFIVVSDDVKSLSNDIVKRYSEKIQIEMKDFDINPILAIFSGNEFSNLDCKTLKSKLRL